MKTLKGHFYIGHSKITPGQDWEEIDGLEERDYQPGRPAATAALVNEHLSNRDGCFSRVKFAQELSDGTVIAHGYFIDDEHSEPTFYALAIGPNSETHFTALKKDQEEEKELTPRPQIIENYVNMLQHEHEDSLLAPFPLLPPCSNEQ